MRADSSGTAMAGVFPIWGVMMQFGIAHKGFVLASGRNRFTGTGAELLADPEVAKSFLGG